MFASVTCPACRHKYTIPEGAMGSRQNCPNCRTPFLAGKSVSEGGGGGDVPMKYEPAAASGGLNKTMLGETGPPVKYNCPRCKKALESPASEAGTKKPCPACGQRLQVPQPPPPPPGLNKTMLASDDAGQATGVAAGAPPGHLPMGTVLPGGAAAPGVQAAAKPLHQRPLVWAAGALGGFIFLLLCTCLILALFSGPSEAQKRELADHQKKYEQAQKDLEQLKRDIQAQQDKAQAQKQQEMLIQSMLDQFKERERNLQKQFDRELEAYRDDQAKLTAAKRAKEQRERELDEDKARAMKQDQEAKEKYAKLQGELEALKQKQQQATTIVQQPPPVVYPYPYYHPYRYWNPWW
jgi:DNA-directed RNA polymerase subunit RPC12/RpoP